MQYLACAAVRRYLAALVVGGLSSAATMVPGQTLDAFSPTIGTVSALAIQPDGKILAGDTKAIYRFFTNGARDVTVFSNSTPIAGVLSCILVQPDSRVIGGGTFTGLLGAGTTIHLARFNADGSLDPSFTSTPNGVVNCLAFQPDGCLLIGGAFTSIAGQAHARLARLNPDGSLDSTFNASVTGPSSPIYPPAEATVICLAVQPDGGILVGGSFTGLDGVATTNLGRLYADGSLDRTFTAPVTAATRGLTSSSAEVDSLLVQPDGLILVGGAFTAVSGSSITNLARLNPDGSRDASFLTGSRATVAALALQTDGKILVAGQQSGVLLTTVTNLWRLNANGARDTSFIVRTSGTATGFPGTSLTTDALAIQADGKVVFGGAFASVDSQPHTNLARVNNTANATQELDYDGATVTWWRGGTSPEVWRTTFDASTNGVDWIPLGAGVRISGGWQLSGLSVPMNATLRARGFLTGGQYNGSGWFTETALGPPALYVQPTSRTNNAGTQCGFSVQAAGSATLGFQWFKDGVALTNNAKITGAQTSTLTLSNVFGANAGAYCAVVSNGLGSATSTVATLTVIDPLITRQPASLAAAVGQMAAFSIVAVGTTPLSYQWLKNGTPISGATTAALFLTNLARADAATYAAVVNNSYGNLTSTVAMLTINLAALDSFGSGAATTNGAPSVKALALQPDNKILAGGSLTALGGQPASEFGRLNPDGSADLSFNANASADSPILSLAVQEDGDILVAGYFSSLNGQALYGLGRVDGNGTFDSTFNAAVGAGLNPPGCLALESDGEILFGGGFLSLASQPQRCLGQLYADGSLDLAFAPSLRTTLLYPQVSTIAVQGNGEVLAGGTFTSVDGMTVTNLTLLLPDGTLDTGFLPQADGTIYCLAVQPDGRVVVGGDFSNIGGQHAPHLARLNPDGSLDASFTATANDSVYTVALQTDGRMVVGGAFTSLDGQVRNYLGRLNADGSLDLVFDPEANAAVDALLIQPDGKILAGGLFTSLHSQVAYSLARLLNPDAAVQSLGFDDSSITWLRSGASPEVWRTSLAWSTNGVDWMSLGSGTRIDGGWQLTGLALPPTAAIRARGIFNTGQYNGSSSLIESYAGRTVIAYQPVSLTNNASTAVSFTVLAGGTPPLSYQWFKNGVLLTDNGTVAGTQAATLWLSNVFGADAGAYAVVVTNSLGSATSAAATLTVIDPLIAVQPTSQWTNAGQPLQLSVVAVGTTPLSYQWRQNGAPFAGATTSALTLANVQKTSTGLYDVLITNRFGALTSAPAAVSVNLATPDTAFMGTVDNEVDSMILQPDGKLVLGGWFDWIGGQACSRIGRMNADGTVDANFTTQIVGSPPYYVAAMALQPDGAILVGGGFSGINGLPATNIARLFPDGSLDTNFMATCWLPGTDNGITCLALQPDGKILAGGYFATLGGAGRSYLGRLNPDGSVDGFNPGADGNVFTLAVQTNGMILVGGAFTRLAGQPRAFLARVDGAGNLDPTFDPGASNAVYALAVQPDGKILVGGGFTNLAGQPCAYLGRLNPDGSHDPAFNPGANGIVDTLALQADGRILVGGRFTLLGGQSANYLCRLNADGSRDMTFHPMPGDYVTSLVIQPDGKTVVGGSLNGPLNRLNTTDPVTQDLSWTGSTIAWSRGGAGPEFWRTTFEAAPDGTNWTLLGAGARVAGGWRLDGASAPPGAAIRARGWVGGGYFNGSAWFVETTVIPPAILVNDGQFGLRTGGFGFNTRAVPGQAVIIEASTNFVNWQPLQTNLAPSSGSFYFTDPNYGRFPRRFYRARLYSGGLPAPGIVSTDPFFGWRPGGFGFNLSGIPGQTVVIESSTNLYTWVPLATNVLGAGTLYFSDPASTNLPVRFYRAR